MQFGPFLDPEMSGDQFAEAPLFREIQRVLASSSGPVNWELARQVGVGSSAGDDPAPTEKDQRSFEDSVRAAELQIAEFTGLEPPNDVAPVLAVRRAQWIQANLESLRGLIEPAAARIGAAVERSLPQVEGQTSGVPPQMLSQMSSLLLGAQVGTVLGYLAQRVLGQYDIAVPRPAPASLLFIVPNIAAFERDWSLSPMEFRAWVALHEVTHRFEFASAWTRDHFRALLDDFLSTLELDVGSFQERFERMDIANPEAMQGLLDSEEGLFGTVLDDEQRLKLARIQAFMAAAEGYGDHVMHTLGGTMLTSYDRIEEAMRRYREEESSDPVFERLLGIEMKREQYRAGKEFCDRVVELTDERTLARMWSSVEALPSLPEIGEPRLWLARTV
ncbi:MAG: zinc-dependent metalloprotease [Actinomycetota bacterium]|nr:zinc-dependent metalloprotease [Actinomycetota bacterium]